MMAPPLDPRDPRDLHDRPWKRRSSSVSAPYFRLPRRSRRATYICWTVVVFVLYFVLSSATQWSHVPDPRSFYSRGGDVPIQYSHLYASLSKITGGGNRAWNRNVLFAAGNLDAASKLAGIACEMSMYGRSNVHFALIGDNDMDMERFREFNGITEENTDCRAIFHDARADFTELMSVERKKLVVRTALRHLRDFMHPQVLIMSAEHEDGWFSTTLTDTAKKLRVPTIELPWGPADGLRWITRLDSGSLSAWHKPNFEIVIHADKHSGNLERLLKSLESAFYPTAHHRPKSLTVILNPSVPLHPFTKSFLSRYSFPSPSRTFIRRPLTAPKNPLESAKQYIESFYPDSDDTSVLVLDSNAEVSKWYYHYLLFTTLEYKYSSYQYHDTASLFGVSLEEPPSYLNGSSPFNIPALSKGSQPSPFLYPVPNTRAALFFPKYWSEFHTYFSKNLLHPHKSSPSENDTEPVPFPLSDMAANSWIAPILDIIRARGYVMLYPAFAYESLAIVHHEQPSYTRSIRGGGRRTVKEKPLMEKNNLLDSLPNGDLPVYNSELPLIDWWGRPALWDWLELDALNYRKYISNCKVEDTGLPWMVHNVDDIFCDTDGNSLE
ncbi:unnamed protein product [Tuber aestivum]|uniref:Uncharacterized protein n=1 Tax=Tuber aestivum TaxID=59557 RepID=A0A292Q9N0_9PEZI|nr:unnamed protein product [Tuber aestivum]